MILLSIVSMDSWILHSEIILNLAEPFKKVREIQDDLVAQFFKEDLSKFCTHLEYPFAPIYGPI